MGVITVRQEFFSPIAPSRMFKALIFDAHNLMPKIMPQAIKSIETISGEGGPGSIEQINFSDSSPFKYVKHRLDVIDEELFHCKYTMIEGDAFLFQKKKGDALGEKLEFITYDVKFEASPDGGCVSKMTSDYHTKAGIEIKEEEILEGKEKAMGMYNVVEAYLSQNPNVYA